MALVCADSWARQADKGPVKSKSPADVAAVFERLLARTKGKLVVVSTDGGAEFKCVRAEMHGRRPIAQMPSRGRMDLLVVGAAWSARLGVS